MPPCTDAFHDCWSEQRERHQMAHIAVTDMFSGCDLLGRHRGFPPPVRRTTGTRGTMLEVARDLSAELQPLRLGAPDAFRRHDASSASEQDGSFGGRLRRRGTDRMAEALRRLSLICIPSRLSSTRSTGVLVSAVEATCLWDLILLSIASTACLSSAAAKPQALRVEASAARSESIYLVPAITANSVRSAGRRHPLSSGFAVPPTSLFETKYR